MNRSPYLLFRPKFRTLFFSITAAFFLSACGEPTDIEEESVKISDIHFPDPVFATCVTETGALTVAELTTLSCNRRFPTRPWIADVSGIEQLTALTELTLLHHSLEALDLSTNPAITSLNLQGDSLTKLDLYGNPALVSLTLFSDDTDLDAEDNTYSDEYDELFHRDLVRLPSLDLSDNHALAQLSLHNTSLKALDLGQNSSLTSLTLSGNGYLDELILPEKAHSHLTSLFVRVSSLKSLDLSGSPLLTSLSLHRNSFLASINTSQNKHLKKLSLHGFGSEFFSEVVDDYWDMFSGRYQNSLTSLDLSQNAELETLVLNGYDFSSLDLHANTSLQSINIYSVNLETIDFSRNLELSTVMLDDTKVQSLEFFNHHQLKNLVAPNNQLFSVNLSSSHQLEYLNLLNNRLQGLDVSENRQLRRIFVGSNPLTEISLSLDSVLGLGSYLFPESITSVNLHVGSMTDADTACMQISKLRDSFSQSALFKTLSDWPLTCAVDSIPDKSLYDCVIKTAQPPDEIETLTCDGVTDITGIDALSNIVELNLSGTFSTTEFPALSELTTLTLTSPNILELDLSKNAALNSLTLSARQIRQLDLPKNSTALVLSVDSNINDINVSNASSVTRINISFTYDALADLSAFTSLNSLRIPYGTTNIIFAESAQITELELEFYLTEPAFDFSLLPHLEVLRITGYVGGLFSMDGHLFDLSSQTKLRSLTMDINGIFEVNLSKSTSLEDLVITDGALTRLDISQNITLTHLDLSGTYLQALDLSNNSELLTVNINYLHVRDLVLPNPLPLLASFDIEGNRLSCETLDLVMSQYSDLIPNDVSTAAYSQCVINTQFPDITLANCVRATGLDLAEITQLECIDVGNTEGIQALTALEELTLRGSFEHLDLRKNKQLIFLEVSNALIDLDVSENTALETLKLYSSTIAEIDLSNNSALQHLHLVASEILTVDLSKNVALETLNIQLDKIDHLDLTHNTNLMSFKVYGGQVTDLNLSKNTSLKELTINADNLNELNLDNNVNLNTLRLHSNTVETIDISKNKLLTVVDVRSDQLTSIDLSAQTNLSSMSITSSSLLSLDVSSNHSLSRLVVTAESLTEIDISNTVMSSITLNEVPKLKTVSAKNTQLESFYTLAPLETIDLSGSTQIGVLTLNGTDNKLASLDLSDLVNLQRLTVNKLLSDTLDLRTNNLLYSLTIAGGEVKSILSAPDNDIRHVNLTSLTMDTLSLNELPKLEALGLIDSRILRVDLSDNNLLKILNVFNVPLEHLDLATDAPLKGLILTRTLLTEIDLSTFTQLQTLRFMENRLSQLDVSNNTALQNITIIESEISCDSIISIRSQFRYKISLSLDVDKENQCSFEKFASEDMTRCAESEGKPLSAIEALSCSDIDDLSGLEYIANLNELTLNSDNLTEVDISKNAKLETLVIESPKMTTFNLTNKRKLKHLTLNTPNLTNFQSPYTILHSLNIVESSLHALDLGNINQLSSLQLANSPLTALQLPSRIALLDLIIVESQLDELDLSKQVLLQNLHLESNPLSMLILPEVSANPTSDVNDDRLLNANALNTLEVVGSQLYELDLFYSRRLEVLTLNQSQFATVNIDELHTLQALDVSNNRLESLGLSNNAALRSINADNNQLLYLDTYSTPMLEQLHIFNNPISGLDFSGNPALRYLHISKDILPIDLETSLLVRDGFELEF